MDADTILDTTATETLVLWLTKHFGYPVRLGFTKALKRHLHGWYTPGRKGTIRVSRKTKVWIVCHEFAHHLDEQINHKRLPIGANRKLVKVGPSMQEGHSESFYRNLLRVIEAVGIKDYPWQKEYRQIARWAKRDGRPSEARETKGK